MSAPQRHFGQAALEHACTMARLELDEQRKTLLGPTIEQMYADIDTLDLVELGETPPATAFDARWE